MILQLCQCVGLRVFNDLRTYDLRTMYRSSVCGVSFIGLTLVPCIRNYYHAEHTDDEGGDQ